MRTLLLTLFFLGFLTRDIRAQQKFLAYRISGDVVFATQKGTARLKIGKVLPESATVRVGTNASVMMICENASKPIILKPGTHKLTAYIKDCTREGQSITASYLSYVWWQLTNPKSSAAEERRKTVTGPGAVSRGCPGVDFDVPDTLNYYQANVLLKWNVYANSKKEFALYQYSDGPIPLYITELKKDELHLDSLAKYLQPGYSYYWTVRLDGNEVCPRKLIQVWNEEDFREYADSLSKGMMEGIDEAERNYIMGYMMEKNLFTGEAFIFYKRAYKENPNNKRYKRTITRFRKQFGKKKD